MQFATSNFFNSENDRKTVKTDLESKFPEAQVLDNKAICFVHPNGDVIVSKVSRKTKSAW